MLNLKDKKIDDERLENVAGGRFNPYDPRGAFVFGKSEEGDSKVVASKQNGQRVTTPETIMRA